jgi:hypothetical protein
MSRIKLPLPKAKARRNDPSARAFGSDIPGALGEQGILHRAVHGRFYLQGLWKAGFIPERLRVPLSC